MAKIIEMPKLSDTMTEGAIARWIVAEGDKIQPGMPIVEIETDKATMEYESPAGGNLLKILVGDKSQCPLNAPIAVIGKPGENWEEELNKHQQKTNKQSAPATENSPPKETHATTATPPIADTTPISESPERIKVSPLARKIAASKKVDLSSIRGTGPGGRIVQRDVESFTASPAIPAATADDNRIPVTMMRKTIARRLVQSVTEAPHFYLTLSVDVGPLMDWRKRFHERSESKFSLNDILIHFVARTLHIHPEINASWQGDHIIQSRTVHMGVAVALPTGLVTPVVKEAHRLSVTEIAENTQKLARLAREGKMQNEDFQGATFCISNLGMYGIEEFTAIINPPQAAILAVGAITPTPVVNEDGSIGVKRLMKMTLSCDHRVIDGAMGAVFLKDLKTRMEDPLSALLL